MCRYTVNSSSVSTITINKKWVLQRTWLYRFHMGHEWTGHFHGHDICCGQYTQWWSVVSFYRAWPWPTPKPTTVKLKISRHSYELHPINHITTYNNHITIKLIWVLFLCFSILKWTWCTWALKRIQVKANFGCWTPSTPSTAALVILTTCILPGSLHRSLVGSYLFHRPVIEAHNELECHFFKCIVGLDVYQTLVTVLFVNVYMIRLYLYILLHCTAGY